MKRTLVAIIAAWTAATGCSSLNPFGDARKPQRDVLTDFEWRQLKQDNQARLAGEGRGPAPRPTASGVIMHGVDEGLNFLETVFWTFPKRIIQYYAGQTPGRFARMMEDSRSADARRTGVLELAIRYDFARKGIYTKRYQQIAANDPDYLVRAAAIRALNRSRNRDAVPLYIQALEDPAQIVRLEAAKALANIPDESAIVALTRHAMGPIELRGEGGRTERQTENRDVRLACADALRNFRDAQVARSLVELLRDRDFEVSWQSRQSLILMTGHDYRYNQDKWRSFLAENRTPFG